MIPNEIKQFIKENNVLTLANIDTEPLVCAVYYGYDESLNLYILTDPDSTHGKMIQKNPKVAFNIFDSRITVTQPKKASREKGSVCR